MTPVLPAPIMLPDFLSCPCAQVLAALVVLFTRSYTWLSSGVRFG